MVEHRVTGKIDLAGDLDAFRLGLDAGELDAVLGGERGHAVEAAEEIEVPPRAAEFAVGRALQADRLLVLDDDRDLAVLDRLELGSGDLALLPLGARLLEAGGAQQASDVIGAEGRFRAWHDVSPGTSSCPAQAGHPVLTEYPILTARATHSTGDYWITRFRG